MGSGCGIIAYRGHTKAKAPRDVLVADLRSQASPRQKR